MPFVQIFIPEGTVAEEKKALSAAVHESLVNVFRIPQDDFFQVVRTVPAEDLFYADSYLGIQHSAKLVYVHITAREGRSPDLKKALYKAIAGAIAANTGFSINDVIIVLSENSGDNWSFGQGIGQYMQ
ncbi:tautomerase family protein [Deminuibacter soli]|uniref:Tautomerase family protein n=1 Tax=Deminuibacter soli TaxID=2291815 RepID=A0A3E1NG07_9BACT|nr:tautomerase family protein [Deminuibacter soli]RFM26754.1 tautomerase family protein [Deminuibacter soli]